MFLKSLTLKGFKSFADSTVLDMEPGVTVVVGPNGSGKSNVVDAIAWVLGAQAPSAVRSQKMDDVVFAGTASRPALGRAEVSLTIDNSAGLLPIDFEEVTITRTLFREGDSEYCLNGVPCRLLDIQELLSDSGVGRQQHVIVSQGQIDAVLNARPEERRAIIEEAAGVLKFRRRREKAERRLRATEENLTRVQDLLREVRRQARPLARQAEAARRHGDLVEELSQLRIHLAGREIDALRGRRQLARDARNELNRRQEALEASLRESDEAVTRAEARLSATGADDIGDQLARAEGRRERARGLLALLTERIGGLGRELESGVDQGVVETLEAEAHRLRREIDEVEADLGALRPDTDQVAAAELQIAEQRSLFDHERTDAPSAPAGEAAEVRGRLAAVSEAVGELGRTHQQLATRLPELTGAESRLLGELTRLDARLASLADDAEQAGAALAGLADGVSAARAAVVAADELVHEAESERRAWTARADALSLALEEARAASGAERLADIDGVLGPLLELIDIDHGWEGAFEAAAGGALAAVVVRDVHAARTALDRLRHRGVAGGVLSLDRRDITGSRGALRRHVRAEHPAVERLLDQLIGHVEVVEDWAAGVDAALARPDLVFVSRQGDRFAPDGWRVGMTGSGATGAALEEALQRAEHAIAGLDRARRERARAGERLEEAIRAHDRAQAQAAGLDREREAGRERAARVGSDLRATRVEAAAVRAQLAEVAEQLARDRALEAELREALPALEVVEAEHQERTRRRESARDELEREAAAVGARRAELEVRVAALDERRRFLRSRSEEVDARLEGYAQRRAEAAARRLYLERRLALAQRLRTVVDGCSTEIDAELAELRSRRQAQSDAAKAAALRLDELRRGRVDTERQLVELREQITRNDLEQGEIGIKLDAVMEALRRDHDCEPGAAVATACPPLDGITPAARVRELERELRIMGPINPLALEEYEALSERQQFLEGQLDDVRASRRELNKVIRAVDEEIVSVFSAAYADVSANFEHLFDALFPGGTGRLSLSDPGDLLDTGVEIEAKPSGKNVKKLSLLSGGERSLAALAFLFAVFRSRPSPFYVMDEVEAALDDVNLHRFLQLVGEFRDEAQLIIVSHQKRTMEAADCLFGITMQPGGSSRALSEKPGADIDLTEPEPVAGQWSEERV